MPVMRVVAVVGFLFAAAVVAASPPGTLDAAQQAVTPTPPSDPEIAVLEVQLEEMRRSEDRMVNTVYWALGIVLTIAAGLIAVNILNGFRTYQHDKEAMRRELAASVQSGLTDVRQEVAIQFQRERAESGEDRAKFETRVQSQAEERYKSFADRFEVFQGQLRIEMLGKYAESLEKANDHAEQAISLHRSLSDNMDSRIKSLDFRLYDAQSQIHMLNGSYALLLDECTTMLEIALDGGSEWIIRLALQRILTALQNLESIPHFAKPQLLSALDKVVGSHTPITKKIRQRLLEITGDDGELS